jgi:hypothetical protein
MLHCATLVCANLLASTALVAFHALLVDYCLILIDLLQFFLLILIVHGNHSLRGIRWLSLVCYQVHMQSKTMKMKCRISDSRIPLLALQHRLANYALLQSVSNLALSGSTPAKQPPVLDLKGG